VANPQRILIVDDSPTELALARSVLQQAGYQVRTATDGDQAIELADKETPDLVVLDVVMPRKNGFQVCRHLKMGAATKGVKVLMLSSKGQEADRFWAMKQGADLYMTKPFDARTLLTNVESLLN
jgi:Response regulators consisting of a CheY-like receiver domain and a winged-helix DNA-binding domain